MSNYPPGVSGNEYQIAGPSSEVEDVREVSECVNLGTHNVMRVVRGELYEFDSTAVPRKYTRNTTRRVKSLPCTFEGEFEVGGTIIDHTTFYWYCPSCGAENEQDVSGEFEYEPDPDEAWMSRYDD